MIFYFTGTGNSQWGANKLNEFAQGPVISINTIFREKKDLYSYSPGTTEPVLFVFPVHSWGVPAIVKQFIKQLVLENYQQQPVYGICTCGDDCGFTRQIFSKSIRDKGWNFACFYSITMPNNYILFPGFDVDSPEVKNKKLSAANDCIQLVGKSIRDNVAVNLYTQGSFPFVKSRIIYPLFNKYSLGKNSFYVTDACISCGLCAKVCPTNTISMINRKPFWNTTCIQCVACIHRCPERAIEYGKLTQNKGRYVHPDVK